MIIYKYTFDAWGECNISTMADEDVVLSVGMSAAPMGEFPSIWVQHEEKPTGDPQQEKHRKTKTYKMFGTGHEFTSRGKYIGTFRDGNLIFHVYELA